MTHPERSRSARRKGACVEPRAIRLLPTEFTAVGLRPVDALEAIQTAYEGTVVGQIYRDNEVNDIAVTLDPASRENPEDIGGLILPTPSDQRVPLRTIADVFRTGGASRFCTTGPGGGRPSRVIPPATPSRS